MLDYLLLDVFAESALAGNQLAVVPDAAKLDTELMQALAREFNLSETSFVCSPIPADGAYDVRIFTPMLELPFAGHPTLGTAWAIRHLGRGSAKRVTLRLGVGEVPVDFEASGGAGEIAWMRPPSPVLGVERERVAIAEMLGLSATDLDPEFPVQEGSVGIPFLLVPLTGLDALKRARVDPARRQALLARKVSAFSILVFCKESYAPELGLAARLFFEANGIREDPATGSANSCLGAYLSRHRYLGADEVDVRVGQGYEIERPSTLYVRARDAGAEVSVGGRVVLVARGQLVDS